MSNSTRYRGLGGSLCGVEKGLRIQLAKHVNKIEAGMKPIQEVTDTKAGRWTAKPGPDLRPLPIVEKVG